MCVKALLIWYPKACIVYHHGHSSFNEQGGGRIGIFWYWRPWFNLMAHHLQQMLLLGWLTLQGTIYRAEQRLVLPMFTHLISLHSLLWKNKSGPRLQMMAKIVMPRPVLCINFFQWSSFATPQLPSSQPKTPYVPSILQPQCAGRNPTRHSQVQWLREMELLAPTEG